MAVHIRNLFLAVLLVSFARSAPITDKKNEKPSRQQKSLGYFDYIQPDFIDFSNYIESSDDYSPIGIDENDLSRTVPSRKRLQSRPYNSPIYYIRMPPQPYMFIPGLGYVPQSPPHHNPLSPFLNVPVNFVSNGKPSTIYQWAGGLGQFPEPEVPPRPAPTLKPHQRPVKPTESSMHRLPGQYAFNGKPEDIFVLRDSYNSLYSDALQNFYP